LLVGGSRLGIDEIWAAASRRRRFLEVAAGRPGGGGGFSGGGAAAAGWWRWRRAVGHTTIHVEPAHGDANESAVDGGRRKSGQSAMSSIGRTWGPAERRVRGAVAWQHQSAGGINTGNIANRPTMRRAAASFAGCGGGRPRRRSRSLLNIGGSGGSRGSRIRADIGRALAGGASCAFLHDHPTTFLGRPGDWRHRQYVAGNSAGRRGEGIGPVVRRRGGGSNEADRRGWWGNNVRADQVKAAAVGHWRRGGSPRQR
jgi:hypothetical protein